MVASRVPLYISYTNPDYLEDYSVITKMDNPEGIRLFIEHVFKKVMVIILKDLPDKPNDVFHPSKKMKQVASVAHEEVHKPSKKIKEIREEIEEVICSTILIPSKTRCGSPPPKVSSSSVLYDAPLRREKLRKLCEIEEDEEEEDVSYHWSEETKLQMLFL